MTAFGSSASRGTRRATSACTSRYSAGVRTSITSTRLPACRIAPNSPGVMLGRLMSLLPYQQESVPFLSPPWIRNGPVLQYSRDSDQLYNRLVKESSHGYPDPRRATRHDGREVSHALRSDPPGDPSRPDGGREERHSGGRGDRAGSGQRLQAPQDAGGSGLGGPVQGGLAGLLPAGRPARGEVVQAGL